MGNVEYLDKEQYEKNQSVLTAATQCFSDCNVRMLGSADNYYLQKMMNHYDKSGSVSAGVNRFKDAAKRLTDLRDAMAAYLKEWEQAQENAKGKFGSIDGEGDLYSGPSFADLYQSALTTGPNYELSRAYQFALSGITFSSDYNDLGSFIWSSDYGKKVRFQWGLTQLSNKENYWNYFTSGNNDGGYELLNDALTSSLESMLLALPGYEGMDAEFVVMDWNKIGQEMGIPQLGNWMKLVMKVLSVVKNAELQGIDVDPECYEELARFMNDWDYQMCDVPWFSTFVENTVYALAGFSATGNDILKHASKFADGLGQTGKMLMNVQEFSEFTTQMLFHMCSSHELQVSYLNTLRESLEVSGFTHGEVMSKIQQLEEMYSDKMVYFTEKLYAKVYDQAFGSITGAVSEIPGLKEAVVALDLTSAASKVAYGKNVSAMSKLAGLYQYDEVLTRTFENYTSLMEQGLATELDVQRANDLFDMLVITKKQEYQNILTIVDDKKSEWFALATKKLEELDKLTLGDATTSELNEMLDTANEVMKAAINQG